jgi:hypothetical protein
VDALRVHIARHPIPRRQNPSSQSKRSITA